MTHEQTNRDFWKQQPSDVAGWAPEQASWRAARLRGRVTLARHMILLVALACLGWAAYLFSAAESLSKTVAALPWILISVGAAFEWWKRRTPPADATDTTSAYWRGQLIRDVQDCRRLASWQGFATLLGIMWLTIGSRIAADGVGQAFAQRGIAEGLAIVLLAPVAVTALVHLVWRWHLRRVAAARQLELDYLELLTRGDVR